MKIYSYSTQEKHEKPSNKKKSRGWKSWKNWRPSIPKLKTLLIWTFRLGAFGFLALAILFTYFWVTLPSPEKLANRIVPESTKILDRNGNLLYEVHGEYKRTLVQLKDIDQDVLHATVAIEDKDFYKHRGISPWAMFRTVITDVIYRKTAGASTITQQFVKNAVLTNKKSPIRKLKEIFLAVQIDAKYSKDEILGFYLNEIPYGRNAYGIEAAAQAYYSKSAKELTVAEAAYLAALPQAPSYYSPFGANRKALDNRQQTILKYMEEQNYITADQHKQALEEKVEFKEAKTALIAPHFVLYVQDYLGDKFGEKSLQEGGLKVYTTLDSELQKTAERIVKESVEKNGPKYDANNAGLVAIDPKTGQILAMVGSKDYFAKSLPEGCTPGKNCVFEPNVNVTVADRQPGSSFKPYVYAAAFKKEAGYSPATMLMDVTTNFGTFNGKPYIPNNYSFQNYGPVSMRQALAGSLNIPAVKTLSLVGVENATQTARDLGITTPLQDCGLSLVLGGCEVKLLDHTAAMSVFANGGMRNDKTAILKIENKDGEVLEEFKQNEHEAIDPQAAYQLINIMTDNAARSYIFGANSPLNFGDRPVGCKTGTTNNWHDGWTMCFTPSLAVGVWSGNNDGKLLKKGADGIYVAAPIANSFLKEALKGKPVEQFKKPEGITEVTVDKISGKLPTQFTTETKNEVFASYNVPKDYDDVHIAIKVDLLTGEPATELTPIERVGTKVYTVLHSERKNNPSWEDAVVKWATEHGYPYPPGSGIVIPGDNQTETSTPSDFNLNITSPSEDSLIFTQNFEVNVEAPPGTPIARMELYIDGQKIDTKTSSPYTFQVSKKLADGTHNLVVKAVDSSGKTGTSSQTITYAANAGLYITVPKANDQISFPKTFYALSKENLGQVGFYYQVGNNTPNLVGNAPVVDNGGVYRYSINVQDLPATGQIKVFAKSETGVQSNKVTVTVQE